ncbi:MAG: hypothetical protein HY742_04205 [Deltaproteobacteria bacterium]|nr:hypothetical protein [Deltaproteobacteria bacterium]
MIGETVRNGTLFRGGRCFTAGIPGMVFIRGIEAPGSERIPHGVLRGKRASGES